MIEIATIDWFGRWGTSVSSENTAIFKNVIIPSAKRSFSGVYCFQHVRHSEFPSFRQHLRFLPYNFDSFCPILFKFIPHLNHQRMLI